MNDIEFLLWRQTKLWKLYMAHVRAGEIETAVELLDTIRIINRWITELHIAHFIKVHPLFTKDCETVKNAAIKFEREINRYPSYLH